MSGVSIPWNFIWRTVCCDRPVKGQTLRDPTDMCSPELSHPQSQNIDSGVPGPGEGHIGCRCFTGTQVPCGKMDCSGDGWDGWLHNNMNVVYTTELHP